MSMEDATMISFQISPVDENNVEKVSRFARNKFESSLAIFYNDEGIEEFHDSMTDVAMMDRMSQLSRFFQIELDDQLVGFLELHRIRHISCLLLESKHQTHERIQEVLDFIISFVQEREPNQYMTIHAAPTAYSILKRLGFKVTRGESIYEGGVSTFMKLEWSS